MQEEQQAQDCNTGGTVIHAAENFRIKVLESALCICVEWRCRMLAWTLSLINLNNKLSNVTLHDLALDHTWKLLHRVVEAGFKAARLRTARTANTTTENEAPGTSTGLSEVHWLRKLISLLVITSFASTSSSCSLEVTAMYITIVSSSACHDKIV